MAIAWIAEPYADLKILYYLFVSLIFELIIFSGILSIYNRIHLMQSCTFFARFCSYGDSKYERVAFYVDVMV